MSNWEPVFVIFLVGGVENWTLSPKAWLSGLWPPRERAHREVRGCPLSLLHGSQGLCWTQVATGRYWGVTGPLALCLPMPSFMGERPRGMQSLPAGPGLLSPGLTLGLTLGPAHYLHWDQEDGWAVMLALSA